MGRLECKTAQPTVRPPRPPDLSNTTHHHSTSDNGGPKLPLSVECWSELAVPAGGDSALSGRRRRKPNHISCASQMVWLARRRLAPFGGESQRRQPRFGASGPR